MSPPDPSQTFLVELRRMLPQYHHLIEPSVFGWSDVTTLSKTDPPEVVYAERLESPANIMHARDSAIGYVRALEYEVATNDPTP